MALNVDEAWLKAYQERTGKGISGAGTPAPAETPEKRTKYGNVKEDGFDSRHEKRCYEELRMRCIGGEFRGLARQVTFYLPGGVKYIADFVTLNNDGSFTAYDAKSDATRKDKVYRIKRRLMEECLKIPITEM